MAERDKYVEAFKFIEALSIFVLKYGSFEAEDAVELIEEALREKQQREKEKADGN